MKLNFNFGKEWKELKKFEKLPIKEKSIVFYAENIASINHFQNLITKLTKEKKLQICYVTSVENDPFLNKNDENVKTFYIGNGVTRTKFFLTLKAKILIMDMPDLETFHIKRSKVYPVHYIYIFHSMFSTHSYLRKDALDNYDTIFCVGSHHMNEIRMTEKEYDLKPKKLVEYGFGRLDTLLKKKQEIVHEKNNDRMILITPSYGKDNLLEKCGIELISELLENGYKVFLRPHFRIIRDSPELINSIKNRFLENSNFNLHEGIIPFEKFQNSMCLISDWSGISFEYAFTHEKPIIFIDVPKKEFNPEAAKFLDIPIEITTREKIGKIVSPNNIKQVSGILQEMINDQGIYQEQIKNVRKNIVFNLGKSSDVGIENIFNILQTDEK
jgi:YidC/Oxa1 family membrane protein insertase